MQEERSSFHDDSEMKKAVSRYEDMLKRKKNLYFDVEDLERIIDFYMEQDNSDSAYYATEFACDQHPSSSQIKIKKAQLLIEQEKISEAREILIQIERIEPTNFVVYILKGNIYLHESKVESALAQYNKALKFVDDHRDEVLYDIAHVLDQYNHTVQAEIYMRKAYELKPNNKEIVNQLAYICERLGKLQKSIKLYNQYLDIDPFSENIWFNLGYCYNRNDNFSKAIECYDFVLAIKPNFSSAIFNKGNSLANLGLYKESIEVYKEFLKEESDVAQALYYIGECYDKINEKEKAREYFDRTLEIENDFADAWYSLGMLDMDNDNDDEALLKFKKAITFDRENSEYYYILGKLLQKIGELDLAIKSFTKATEIDNFDTEAWCNLSFCYVLAGQSEIAIAKLNEGLDYVPNNSDLFYHLAAIYFKDKDNQQGKMFFKLALDSNPEVYKDIFEFYPELNKNSDVMALISELPKED